MAESLGKDNPYRYKGYYYDEETGMYYLKSRYYDPEICRFISADSVTVMIDSPMSLADKNLYAYCDNDPVNKKDESGNLPQFVVLGIIGAVANVGVSFITAKATGQDYGWYDLLKDSLLGALCAIPYTSKMGLATSVLTKVLEDSTSDEGITKGTLVSIAFIALTPDISALGNLSNATTKEALIYAAAKVPIEVGYSCSTAAINQGYSAQKKQGSSAKNKTSGVPKKSKLYPLSRTF